MEGEAFEALVAEDLDLGSRLEAALTQFIDHFPLQQLDRFAERDLRRRLDLQRHRALAFDMADRRRPRSHGDLGQRPERHDRAGPGHHR